MSKEKTKKREQNYGPGNVLRQKREEYEWSIEAVAEALHLSTTSIKSIEDDRYDDLPGATYVLGYWRSYARLLGIDMEDTIEANKRNLDMLVTESHGLDLSSAYHPGRRSGVLYWLVGFILLLGLAYFSWQQNFFGVFEPSVESEDQAAVSAEQPENMAAVEPAVDDSSNVLIAIETPAEPLSAPKPVDFLQTEQVNSGPDNQNLDVLVPAPVPVPASGSMSLVSPNDGSVANQSQSQSQSPADTLIVTPLTQSGLVLSSDVVSPEGAQTDNIAGEQNETTATVLPIQPEEKPGLVPNSSDAADQETQSSDTDEAAAQSVDASVVDGSFIVLSMSKDSWLDVRDSTNKRLLYTTKKSGSEVKIVGTPPFYIYIGTPSGVKLRYQGADVPFETHKSGLFARFKLDEKILQAL